MSGGTPHAQAARMAWFTRHVRTNPSRCHLLAETCTKISLQYTYGVDTMSGWGSTRTRGQSLLLVTKRENVILRDK